MGRMILSAVLALLAVSRCTAAPEASRGMILVQPKRDDSLLVNPGKGFVQYGWTDDYTRDYISVGYNRFTWAEIEPSEGTFHWKPMDDFIQAFKRDGKRSAPGVMCVSTGIGKQYVTPKWVFDDGAAALSIDDASAPTGHQVIPKHWDDPVFLQKMDSFIRAFGVRYDGSPDIAFVDIRDYGNWGEGHTGMLGNDPSTILTPPESLKDSYLMPYFQAFRHSQLIVPWGNSLYNAVYDWAVARGAGMRRDGLLSEWTKDGSECRRAYGHAPAVFEYCYSYAETKQRGYWSTEALRHDIEAGKPSYMQWDPQVFQENKDFCREIGNKVGYHFVLQQVSIPRRVQSNRPMTLKWRWLNDGVAPLYEPCHVALALLDGSGHVVQRQWASESTPNRWAPGVGTAENVTVTFRHVPAGSYRLAVGLFAGQKDAAPAYRLGIQGRTADGWYVLHDYQSTLLHTRLSYVILSRNR